MALIKNRVLAALDAIYNFAAGKRSISEFELDVPIQPVHDLSREAELGAAFGRFRGIAAVLQQNTHAAATTEYSSDDAYTAALAAALDPSTENPTADEVDVWLLHLAMQTTNTANLTDAGCGLTWPAAGLPPAAGSPILPLFWSDTAVDQGNYAGTGQTRHMIQDTGSIFIKTLPLYIPRGAHLTFYSQSSGACTMTAHWFLWIGRKGTTPPLAR